jgi:hypothetical protein
VVKKLVFAIIPCDPYPRPIAGCDCSLIGCAIMPSDPLPDFQLLGSFGSHRFRCPQISTVFWSLMVR